MSLLSQLRFAAHKAIATEVSHGGGDPAELVAVANLIAAREGCLAECWVVAAQPEKLRVRFFRC